MADHAGLTVRLFASAPVALDVQFDCAPGELVAIVGPSGSGKTTLLRAIAGLYTAVSGSVTVERETWLSNAGAAAIRARRVGMVFQDYALFPHLTAQDNVALAMLDSPRAARAERARALLAQVHLAGLEARLPHELSGGQRQRVAVARALAREPKVLLLDEPFSAVDQVTRRKLQRELAQLRQALAIPVVLVTHDLDEAIFLADRMVVISQGRALQTGIPAAVMARPQTREVAELIDFRNVFFGAVVPSPHDRRLDWLGYSIQFQRPCPSCAEGVTWGIPASACRLQDGDRTNRGQENPVQGVVREASTHGEEVQLVLTVLTAAGEPCDCELHFAIPRHAAVRSDVTVGSAITVSLLAEAIHFFD
jgi:molybdate transport system ATP-binding protein